MTKQQEYSILSQPPNVNFYVVAIAASAGGAIKMGCVDFILPLDAIAPTLVSLVMSEAA